MSKFTEKTKSILEWVGHGYLLVQIFGGLGLGTIVRALLIRLTALPSIWITPIWLLSATSFIGIFVIIGNVMRKRAHAQQPSPQPSNAPSITSSSATGAPALDFKNFITKAYVSPFEKEVEDRARAAASDIKENERAEFLVKFVASASINLGYEFTWSHIFRSQLLLLQELNRKLIMPIVEVKAYYDAAAAVDPIFYQLYSFDEWMNFLKGQTLVIVHPTAMVEGTNRSRDFLKFIVHYGRSADDRKL